jgi:ElaB/YqjD/DUF883 family membrane-anchored ribosome-binding protein
MDKELAKNGDNFKKNLSGVAVHEVSCFMQGARVRRVRRNKTNEKGYNMTNEANMEKLGSELKEITSDAEALLQATAGQTGEKMSDLRRRLSSALDSAKVTYHRMQDKTIAGAKAADKTIREHPYESIGVAAGAAFGLGLLLGVLVNRR